MKSTQPKKDIKNNKDLLKNSLIAGLIGFVSWAFLFLIFFPLAGYYKFKETYTNEILILLKNPKLYTRSLVVGLLFFLFFYLTLKYKEKSQLAKVIMWAGVILYSVFYLGYLFLLFFFTMPEL